MPQVGRKIQIGIGKETTPGTPVAADFYIPATDNGLNPKQTIQEDEASRGTIQGNGESSITQEWSEPSFGGNIFDRSIGLLLLAALGTVNTTPNSPEAGVQTHAFTLATTSNVHPALSYIQKDAVLDKVATQAILNNLSLEMVTGERGKFTADFMAGKIATASSTPAFTVENIFLPKHAVVKLAANVAGLTAANAEANIESITLNIEKNAENEFALGSSTPTEINNGTFRATGELKLRLENTTLLDIFLAGTDKAMRITLENTDITIGSSTNPKIEIDLGSVSFRDWAPNNAADTFITQTIPFTIELPASDAQIAINLINTEATY